MSNTQLSAATLSSSSGLGDANRQRFFFFGAPSSPPSRLLDSSSSAAPTRFSNLVTRRTLADQRATPMPSVAAANIHKDRGPFQFDVVRKCTQPMSPSPFGVPSNGLRERHPPLAGIAHKRAAAPVPLQLELSALCMSEKSHRTAVVNEEASIRQLETALFQFPSVSSPQLCAAPYLEHRAPPASAPMRGLATAMHQSVQLESDEKEERERIFKEQAEAFGIVQWQRIYDMQMFLLRHK